MKKQSPARWMLVGSMAIFGTIGLFVRNISVSSGELALYRAVLASVLIGLFLLITRQKIPFGKIKKELPLLLLSGCAMDVEGADENDRESADAFCRNMYQNIRITFRCCTEKARFTAYQSQLPNISLRVGIRIGFWVG